MAGWLKQLTQIRATGSILLLGALNFGGVAALCRWRNRQISTVIETPGGSTTPGPSR
jgi:hypothetical protein